MNRSNPWGFDTETRPFEWFRGRVVTVMGLGLFGGGIGAVKFLSRLGARLIVTDLRSEEALRPALEQLRGLDVRFVLGRHREEDFTASDLVVASPAVHRTHPLLELARGRGIPLESELNLFLKYAPSRIAAVTGSNGKSTTASLLHAMLRERFPRARIGGNVGRSLLDGLSELNAEDWVVLEVSSFQTEDMAPLKRRPEIAVLTNLSPNHLDRHSTFEAYVQAKRILFDPGPAPNSAVLPAGDSFAVRWAGGLERRVVFFGGAPPHTGASHVSEVGGDRVALLRDGETHLLFATGDVRLQGRHNLLNAMAAAAAAFEAGAGPEEIRRGLRAFRGLEHRLELVTPGPPACINDSVSTTPESAIAALEAVAGPCVLIVGGAAKGETDFAGLARAVAARGAAAVCFGACGPRIAEAVAAASPPVRVALARTLEEAFEEALAFAGGRGSVVFSPACPSYDQFVNFEERGRRFKELVRVHFERAAGKPGAEAGRSVETRAVSGPPPHKRPGA